MEAPYALHQDEMEEEVEHNLDSHHPRKNIIEPEPVFESQRGSPSVEFLTPEDVVRNAAPMAPTIRQQTSNRFVPHEWNNNLTTNMRPAPRESASMSEDDSSFTAIHPDLLLKLEQACVQLNEEIDKNQRTLGNEARYFSDCEDSNSKYDGPPIQQSMWFVSGVDAPTTPWTDDEKDDASPILPTYSPSHSDIHMKNELAAQCSSTAELIGDSDINSSLTDPYNLIKCNTQNEKKDVSQEEDQNRIEMREVKDSLVRQNSKVDGLEQTIQTPGLRVHSGEVNHNKFCNSIALGVGDDVREPEDKGKNYTEHYTDYDHTNEDAATNGLLVPRADRGWALGPSHDGLPRYPNLIAQQDQDPVRDWEITPLSDMKRKGSSLDGDQIEEVRKKPRSAI
jgi:hypothetical protein